ncbi:MAG: ornithine carbamoyltransferase [Nitrososphaeria archaeon]
MIRGKSILSLMELDRNEILKILDVSAKLKEKRKDGVYPKLLKDKTLVSIFMKPSTRTRISFNEAMHELGGHCIDVTSTELQLGRGETIEDTAKVISRYCDVIAARVFSHEDVVRLSRAASVPVINSLSDMYHPCQILADLLTIREKKGKFNGIKLAYIGDGNNVCNTLIIGCTKVGIDINLACPKEYMPSNVVINFALKVAESSGSHITFYDDPQEAVKDVDAIYTDTFVSMGQESDKEKRLRIFLPKYQVNGKLVEKAKSDFIFMHCLPAHRNLEVTDEVIDGTNSVVFDQAENRLHTQKGLLCLILLEESEIKI